MIKIIHLLNKFAMSYVLNINKIKNLLLSIHFIYNIVSNIKYFKDSKYYLILKLLIKSLIYFNLFMLSSEIILKYEYDEIYSILFNIYSNIKLISYNNFYDIIKYLKDKFYIGDKLEDLINDNSISNKSNIIDNNNCKTSNSTNYYYYMAISMIVISSGIILYFYFNSDSGNPGSFLNYIDLSDPSLYPTISEYNIPETISRVSSSSSNSTIKPIERINYNFIDIFAYNNPTDLDLLFRSLNKIVYPRLGTTFVN
jgi:hypothetical protein